MEERRKILIIDDDTFILNLYIAKFQKTNQEIVTARSGEEALTQLRNGYVPDAVMIDIVLPDMNGLDLLNQIRSEKLAPDAVYMMVTNQNSDDETARAKSLGVAGYIIKANSTPSEVVSKVMSLAKQKVK